MSEKEWKLTLKPNFLNEWDALPPKEVKQVHQKLKLLTEDPLPDGHTKKRLKHHEGGLCRIRSGDYRVFYTFEYPFVSILGLRKRDESTYGDDLEGESLGGLDGSLSVEVGPVFVPEAWLKPKPKGKEKLPAPITKELLDRLRVAPEHVGKLLAVDSVDDLLNCVGVPDETVNRVLDALVPLPLKQVMQQKDLVAEDVDDLLRFKEGELIAFLLRLNPEQQKFVKWGRSAGGPTLLKGGPGTGKSSVALYRVKEMVAALRKDGCPEPRILFTTYTNALVKFSQQLLVSLLRDDARFVDVRTADNLAYEIATNAKVCTTMADLKVQREVMDQTLKSVRFEGNALVQRSQRESIERLGRDYLLDEIGRVIEARGIISLEEYLAAKRLGRRLALNATQRRAVWRVREAVVAELGRRKMTTWSRMRAQASAVVAGGHGPAKYDAVIVDEVQDLDPVLLRLLVNLCAAPNRLFLTADANQSIYGSHFRWSDVHESLKLQGRVGILKSNHRSTREIGEAAQAYLAGGLLDDELTERDYVYSGPLPVVRSVKQAADEAKLLTRFLPNAARSFRLGLGACAVFCPSEKAGKRIADALSAADVPAAFMPGKELDLAAPGVKVMTVQSCKGLEFPVVALAGFLDGHFPVIPGGLPEEEKEELMARERRTLFVGMTRAMRGLLVVVPAETKSPLLSGFDAGLWNTSATVAKGGTA